MDYLGKCPLCSGQLIDEGEFLSCTPVGEDKHYLVNKVYFEETWARFEGGHITASGLMKRLEDNNVVYSKST